MTIFEIAQYRGNEVGVESNFFCELGALAKFQDPRTNKFLTWKERRKEKKKNNLKNGGHYAPLQGPRATHAVCSDQFNVFPGV